MATDVGVRSALVNSGYANEDIGYDPDTGYVKVKGQNFMKPEMEVNGTTYTSQDNFNKSLNQYRSNQRANQAAQLTDQYTNNATTPKPNQYVDQYTQMIANIQNMMNRPQLDVYSSPQYAAALAANNQNTQRANRVTQEAYGESGFGRSTNMGERIQRNANDANTYLATQVVPQIQQQLDAQRQAEIANQMGLLSPVYNMVNRQDVQSQNQDQNIYNVIKLLNEQKATEDAANNQKTQNDIAKAGILGYYMPSEAQDVINNILNLKQSAEQGGVSEEQMNRYRQAADAERAKLSNMGIDPNQFGYEENYSTAANNAANFKGIQTMQGRNNQLNETQVMAQLTGMMPDGTPTNAAQQQQLEQMWKVAESTGAITGQLALIYGIPEGTPTLQAKQLAISAANSAADNARQNAALGLQQAQFAWNKDSTNPDNMYKMAEINKTNSTIDSKYTQSLEKAVTLAQKDPSFQFATDDTTKQKIINYYVDLVNKSSGGSSDADIAQYLKAK